MTIRSREYGVTDNHLRFVVIHCCIKKQDALHNHRDCWRAKDKWEFDFVKYELRDHCILRFKGIEEEAFVVKMLDISEHSLYDDLYRHDSDDYVKSVILLHVGRLFEKVYTLHDFPHYSGVFEQHIELL